MSEFFNINLLGIIGTVTGIIALVISYRTYSKQKPNLKVEVTNCEHNLVGQTTIQQKAINFLAKFQIKNVGDRGTSINDIVLSFTVDGKKYQFHKNYMYRRTEGANQSTWIEAHDTIDIQAIFNEQFDGTEENQIACIFTIYDTHKTYRVRAISKKRTNSVLSPMV